MNLLRHPGTRAAVLCSTIACGSSSPSGGDIVQDPRPLPEICVKYCANARAHGCESAITLGSSCQEDCEYTPQGGDECQANWRSHAGCLADLPNLCDAASRDEQCLGTFCRARLSCMLPDPRCR